ncbi:hypothetical protein ACHHRT_04245 [Desulfurivibrio sp. D14AmB]|uniref:hypothetical protein n=1 Tax=Desulfurivibrio sp. D14AmB TaxID=3374370 RepID=UPI00376F15D9
MSGCALHSERGGKSFVRENVDFGYIRQVAVLPLQNNSRDDFAPEMLRDILITRVFSQGLFDVVDKGLVDSLLRENAIEPGQALDSHLIKRLGQGLNAQALLLGTVDVAAEGRKGSVVYPELAMTLRLVDVDSGLVIWQAGGNASGDSLSRRLFGLSARDRYQVGNRLVKNLLRSLPR